MSAIFISYTGRDPEGDAWADRLTQWFKEWEYGYFRDKDHSHGVKAGDDWRQTLYRELGEATAMVCLCSKQYENSPWCVGEVAIAVKDGKTVIPIQLAQTAEDLRIDPLPLLLQINQAIKVSDGVNPTPEQLADVKQRLQAKLQEKLNWRDLQHWDRKLSPYPGLPRFEEQQAPVFFGRDETIETVVDRLTALALRPPAFLLLLGTSGYGKSSLVRAGVVPRLKSGREGSWTVLSPFTPGDAPFAELEEAVVDAGGEFDAADPIKSLQELHRQSKAPVLVVIDQFEELLIAGPAEDAQAEEGKRFLAFLQNLLRVRKAGLMLLATMRTDFLAPLQSRWPALTGLARSITLEPIAPEDFGELITGPAMRSHLTLQPGLVERLVNESGGRDALPLLAFTLEKLWKARKQRGVAVAGSAPGEQWDLTLEDYKALGRLAGAVSTRAKECWDPQTSSEEVRAALRETFVDHLVSVSDDGREAKRPAPLDALPLASREIVERMVDDRLLVLKDGMVEIAHEALLRTWPTLVGWLKEGKEELLQRRRVERLCEELAPDREPATREQGMEELARLAALGEGVSEGRAVRKAAASELERLVRNPALPEPERADAAMVLALIGEEQTLREVWADGSAPVGLRRRAAESLGLLAQRSSDGEQRRRIGDDLEGWLRSDGLDLRIKVDQASGWREHDARLPLLQGASRGLQLAASADLPLLGSGPGRVVPMLTLTAEAEEDTLRVFTEVVDVSVWKLPLPVDQYLELVVIPKRTYAIGRPGGMQYTDLYDKALVSTEALIGCKTTDLESQREVHLKEFAMVRHPITQAQWRAVAECDPTHNNELNVNPGIFGSIGLWDRYAQPGAYPVDSVTWENCRKWLQLLNKWLMDQECWKVLGGKDGAPQLALPSESQWEAACNASNRMFHFGDILDASWANFDGGRKYVQGLGREGPFRRLPVTAGFFGLVNSFGLAEMHGQFWEWCADQWHPNPIGEGWPSDGTAWVEEDPVFQNQDTEQKGWKLLRGGSWFADPRGCRASLRRADGPNLIDTDIGFRPCCHLPPGMSFDS